MPARRMPARHGGRVYQHAVSLARPLPSSSNLAWLPCRTGALLLRGEWREAVRAIIAGRADERPEALAARRAYLDRGDVHAALGGIHHNAVAERAILEARSIR